MNAKRQATLNWKMHQIQLRQKCTQKFEDTQFNGQGTDLMKKGFPKIESGKQIADKRAVYAI